MATSQRFWPRAFGQPVPERVSVEKYGVNLWVERLNPSWSLESAALKGVEVVSLHFGAPFGGSGH
jgi:hypothetical protein